MVDALDVAIARLVLAGAAITLVRARAVERTSADTALGALVSVRPIVRRIDATVAALAPSVRNDTLCRVMNPGAIIDTVRMAPTARTMLPGAVASALMDLLVRRIIALTGNEADVSVLPINRYIVPGAVATAWYARTIMRICSNEAGAAMLDARVVAMDLVIRAGATMADTMARAVDLNRPATATTDAGSVRASERLADVSADTALVAIRLNCFANEAGMATTDVIDRRSDLPVFNVDGALALASTTRKKLAVRVIVAGSATLE